MKLFEKKKDGIKRTFYVLGLKLFSYYKLISHFTTLNYNNTYLMGKIIKSKEKINANLLKYLEKYLYAQNNNLNIDLSDQYDNPIWQLWYQGEENMPPIIKVCTESVKKHNPNKNIILLTSKNIKSYVDLPDYIWEKYNAGLITKTHISDIIRLYLLYKYGGTWVDSTIYMTGKIPEYITNENIFVYKDYAANLINPEMTLNQFTILCNIYNFLTTTNAVSFIHAKRGNKLIEKTLKMTYEYWKHENSVVHYLLTNYFITLILFNNSDLKKDFINIPYTIGSGYYGALRECLYEHYNPDIVENIKALTPIHKLTYKNQCRNVYDDSLFNYIIKTGLNPDVPETDK